LIDDYFFPTSATSNYFRTESELTSWLIQNLNIFEAYYPGLRLVTQEKFLPYGRADLWCQTNNGTIVAIENQLGNADADHICRLVAYMMGGHAHVGILICSGLAAPQSYLIEALNQSRLEFWVFKLDMITKTLKVLSSPNSYRAEIQPLKNQAYTVFQDIAKLGLCYELAFDEKQNHIDVILGTLLLVRIDLCEEKCKLTTAFQPSPNTHLKIVNQCLESENVQTLECPNPDMSTVVIESITMSQALNYLNSLSHAMYNL
jgi:hypothetical protein